MPSIGEITEAVKIAASATPAVAHMLDEVLGLGRSATSHTSECSVAHASVIADYVKSELDLWGEKKFYPEFEITRTWTQNQLAQDSAFEHALKSPALTKYTGGGPLSAVEIGAQWDVTVPRVLDKRLTSYTAVDLHESGPIAKAWRQRILDFGLRADNKFRVVGNAAQLPIASQSQDMVFAAYVDPFVYGRGMPAAINEAALNETLRVLKPGGRFLLTPYTQEQEALGSSILRRYFPSSQIHIPDQQELLAIKMNERSSQFQNNVSRGTYRTFVGIKY
jgi:hypothetical protein